MVKNMTNREFYNAVIEANVSNELTAFATAALEQMDSRLATRRSTESKAQKENANLAEALLGMMEAGTTYTASSLGEMLEVSTAKATNVVKILVAQNRVEVSEVKQSGKRPVKGYTIISN
jgi:predicted HTH transcriptional regulator